MTALVVGGSGFIGRHICNRLDARSFDIVDNRGFDAHHMDALVTGLRGCDAVVHLASNADIAAAVECPTLDFTEGTVLTQNVCEAARLAGVSTIVYLSGSGVYGRPWDGYQAFTEDDPFEPVSPYAASKIAGEALVSAYSHMYGIRGVVFRPANIVGPGQTHGVGYDFVRKLRADSSVLEILGDGEQDKSYVAVDDVVNAILLVLNRSEPDCFEVYNVASTDSMTVRAVADMACDVLGVNPRYVFTGGAGGWAGDVPCVRLDMEKLRGVGWEARRNSGEAMRWALENMC